MILEVTGEEELWRNEVVVVLLLRRRLISSNLILTYYLLDVWYCRLILVRIASYE